MGRWWMGLRECKLMQKWTSDDNKMVLRLQRRARYPCVMRKGRIFGLSKSLVFLTSLTSSSI